MNLDKDIILDKDINLVKESNTGNTGNTGNTCNSCFYSSFVFVINVIFAWLYGYYLYAGLFMALIITSLFYHSSYTYVTNIIDKIAILCIVGYGGYLFYNKLFLAKLTVKQYILSTAIIFTFLLTIFMYYYGYLHNCLCFSDDIQQANWFHSGMHCVSCVGHCCIVFL
jgi:hypothetical protein